MKQNFYEQGKRQVIELKNYKEGIYYFERQIELKNGYEANSYHMIGYCNEHLKDYEKAIENYKDALKINPNLKGTCYNLGVIYKHQKQYDNAEKHLLDAVIVDKNYGLAYWQLSLMSDLKGDKVQALEYCKKYIKLEDKSSQGYSKIGQIYNDLGEYSKAIEYLEKAITIDPKAVVALNNYGHSLRMIGKSDQAVLTWQNLILIDHTYQMAYFNLAQIFTIKEDFTNSIQYINKYFQISSDDSKSYYLMGSYLDKFYQSCLKNKFQQNNEQLQQDCGKIILDSLQGMYRGERQINGKSFENCAQFLEEAVYCFKKGILSDKKSKQNYISLINTLIYQNKVEESIKFIEQFQLLNPKDTQNILEVSEFYRRLKKYELAKQFNKQVLQLHPNLSQAYVNLGLIERELNEYQKAIEYFNKAIELDSKKSIVLFHLGYSYNAIKQYDMALNFYQKYLEYQDKQDYLQNKNNNYNQTDVYNNLGIVYRNKGFQDREIANKQQLYFDIKSNKNFINSLQFFEKCIIDKASKNPLHIVNFARSLNEVGEKKRAFLYYNQALEIAKNQNLQKNSKQNQNYLDNLFNNEMKSLFQEINNQIDEDNKQGDINSNIKQNLKGKRVHSISDKQSNLENCSILIERKIEQINNQMQIFVDDTQKRYQEDEQFSIKVGGDAFVQYIENVKSEYNEMKSEYETINQQIAQLKQRKLEVYTKMVSLQSEIQQFFQ